MLIKHISCTGHHLTHCDGDVVTVSQMITMRRQQPHSTNSQVYIQCIHSTKIKFLMSICRCKSQYTMSNYLSANLYLRYAAKVGQFCSIGKIYLYIIPCTVTRSIATLLDLISKETCNAYTKLSTLTA